MKRRGVSLMEVLFAVGVVVVGLLGVMIILPYGLYQVGRGNVFDRSSRLGLNAVEEFEARGMRRPDNWLYADGTPVQSATKILASPHVPVRYSFCIDPMFIAAPENQQATGMPLVTGAPGLFDARFFPYYTPDPASPLGVPAPATLFNNLYNTTAEPFTQRSSTGSTTIQPRMARITLKQAAGVPLAMTPGTPFDLPARLSQLHAERIFMADDDLVFDLPEEKELAPVQNFGEDPAAGFPDPIRRQFRGEFSWMATLVPRADPLPRSEDDVGELLPHTYRLSIVVFHKRVERAMFLDANNNGNYDPGEETDNERIVNVASFDGGGFAGGDLTLQGTTNAQLDIAEGEWLMLAGSTGVAAGALEAPDFKWYQVVATDPDTRDLSLAGTGPYQRVLTLQGPDWLNPEWHLPTTDPAFRPTIAILVKDVIAVYEKLIKLETNTPWPQ